MADMRLLSKNQIDGIRKLKVLDKYGLKCEITDFAILLGGFVSASTTSSEGTSLENRTCKYWVKPFWWWSMVSFVNKNGSMQEEYPYKRNIAIRPVMKYSEISSLPHKSYLGVNGVKIIEYGEYPQSIVLKDIGNKIEKEYRYNKLEETGEIYTTDSAKKNNRNVGFMARQHTVYEYEGKKYIRLVGDKNAVDELLSDGQVVNVGKPYWIKVEPVKWLVDEGTDLLISKNALVAGIQFDYNKEYSSRNYGKSVIKWYLDNYLSKEIFQNKERINLDSKVEVVPPQNIDVSEKIIELVISLRRIEKDVNNEYTRKQNEINSIWNEIENITMKTSEISENQLIDVKKKIKKLNN